jgi:hypothetical protein
MLKAMAPAAAVEMTSCRMASSCIHWMIARPDGAGLAII